MTKRRAEAVGGESAMAVSMEGFDGRRDSGPPPVLVACKDGAQGQLIASQLELDGYVAERCQNAKDVLNFVKRRAFGVAVLDLALAREGDVDLVSFIRRQSPATQIILLFEMSRIDDAIRGIRQGAFFYLPADTAAADVAMAVNKAVRSLGAESALGQLEAKQFHEMLGASPAMRRVVELITKVAPTDSTVLLLGESGTGKELMANAVHRLSRRRDMPFIAINCAALPDTLLESEMFGHLKGAFTGADADKRGLFEEADGGTVFLDEIGDMALVTQAKLLRVLQNGEIRPVGSSTSRRVNVRIIAATNRDLERAVAEREFREDLYFRLNVVQIRVPPLRERMDSLPSLTDFFLSRYSQRYGKEIRRIDDHAQALLSSYSYPGNVRELESIIAHAVIMCDGDAIRAKDLPDSVREGAGSGLALPYHGPGDLPTLKEMEANLIRTALERCEGNQTEAAKKLDISRSTLWRKMKEYGIAPPS